MKKRQIRCCYQSANTYSSTQNAPYSCASSTCPCVSLQTIDIHGHGNVMEPLCELLLRDVPHLLV